ncbi:ABC transporter substrate-binding protein [Fluviispira sanaruensis]|uniref:Uncharacterized protein n=1 Tax=Fluviispira sanaruensis TaxID=2493639 RepID=A0A4P2VYD3_FLUSA|nr:ABC transporter substrate-binding protein [Fluviispira sanaruensis]BBH54705.1 hypothetical protein JCM31447_31790 [Fluviispira sanaruensis]
MFLFNFLIISTTLISTSVYALQEVKIASIFPFQTSDYTYNNATYTSVERLQIISSIPMALMQYKDKAEKCGYYFSFKLGGFTFKDMDSLKKNVQQINLSEPWIVYGPEMNKSYFLVHPNINSIIPHVSSFSLFENIENQYTLSASSDVEIGALIDVIEKKKIGKNFIIITDNTCEMCVIYEESAKRILKKRGFNEKKNILYNKILIKEIKDEVLKQKPDFIFLNLEGSDSGHFIANSNLKQFIFIGTKVWGTDVSSDLTLNYNLKKYNGFTVRPLPPEDYSSINVKFIDNDLVSRRLMDNPYYMKFFISRITDSLCKYKPKDRFEFYDIVSKYKIFLRRNIKFATYVLKEGGLSLENSFNISS